MLTVLCWRWRPRPGYRSKFEPATVNILRRMVARHYPDPHRFACVTDDPEGLDPEVEVIPAWNDFAGIPSPAGGMNPSCYRRLRMFDPAIGAVFGPRFVSLDLDLVVTGDLRPLWNRSEDFVIWGDSNPRTFYNGSMILMTAGARSHVWTRFDPVSSPKASRAAGHFGSDQGWISHCLGPHEMKWTKADGVYSYRYQIVERLGGQLPANARLVVFHGKPDPWDSEPQRRAWVRQHWQ